MAEEKEQIPELNSEDVHALRVLLHAVRGLSVVSTSASQPLPGDE